MVRPSFGAAIGALLVAFTGILLCILILTPDFMRRTDPAMLMTRPGDHYAYVTSRAFQLQEEDPDKRVVVLLGASSFLHALGDDSELETEISRELGEQVQVVNLSAPGENLWEYASICDFVATPNDIFVLDLGAKRIADFASIKIGPYVKRPRFGFITDAWTDELIRAGFDAPKSTGVYFIDNFNFFLARRTAVKNLILGPVKINRYNDARPRLADDEWDEHMARILADFGDYDANSDSNFLILERIVKLLRLRGVQHIAIVNPPVNPRIKHLLPQQMIAKFEDDVQSFAETHDISYWRLDATVGLQDSDFDDWCHIRAPEVRSAYSKELSRRISAYARTGRSDISP